MRVHDLEDRIWHHLTVPQSPDAWHLLAPTSRESVREVSTKPTAGDDVTRSEMAQRLMEDLDSDKNGPGNPSGNRVSTG